MIFGSGGCFVLAWVFSFLLLYTTCGYELGWQNGLVERLGILVFFFYCLNSCVFSGNGVDSLDLTVSA
jgi:hypothetical protein